MGKAPRTPHATLLTVSARTPQGSFALVASQGERVDCR
jgi:hypothetical protein